MTENAAEKHGGEAYSHDPSMVTKKFLMTSETFNSKSKLSGSKDVRYQKAEAIKGKYNEDTEDAAD